jgi:hypothetical protein
MKKLLLLTSFLLAGYFSQANRLLVRSNGAGFAYTSIGEAIDSAQVGDTIVIFPRTDGQQWSLTKTLTKPMVFLNGDTSGNIQYLGTCSFTINASGNNGPYFFSDLGLWEIFNNSGTEIILNNVSAQIYGKRFICFKSSITYTSSIDSSCFYYCSLNIPLSLYNSLQIGTFNSKLIGCRIAGRSNGGGNVFIFMNSQIRNNFFDLKGWGSYDDFQISLEGCDFSNNIFSNNLNSRSYNLYISTKNSESLFGSNFFDGNIRNLSISGTISEGNYFKTATDINVRNTLLANGFKQAPANIQLDSIGRIVGNALVDSGATTPWLRDVDGSPADVGITGGPFPIQNYINPNPGNAQIIHVNIPNRVGFPNRPIPIKATGTSK